MFCARAFLGVFGEVSKVNTWILCNPHVVKAYMVEIYIVIIGFIVIIIALIPLNLVLILSNLIYPESIFHS